MNQRIPWQDPSRRAFLGGAAGLATAAVLPSARSIQAIAGFLTGAIVKSEAYRLTNALTAARIADGFIGMPLATTIQKLYRKKGELGTGPNAEMIQLASAGCHFLLSVRPSQTLSGSQQSQLKAYLAALNQAGIRYRVALWAEMDDVGQFPSRQEWLAYWRYYAPAIKEAGVPCGYDPGCNSKAISRAEAFFPSRPAPDELWMDFYATAFRGGVRIDRLIAKAQAAGIPAGLAEWGWHAGSSDRHPMTMTWWNRYGTYLLHLAGEGKLRLGTIYFGSAAEGLTVDVITSAKDPRIPMIQKLAMAG